MAHHVILVRPWVDAHGGSGCCAGDTRDPIVVDDREYTPVEHPYATRVVAQAYQRLRQELPEVDVQIVSSSNTVYLVPSMLRGRRHGEGLRAMLRRANRATRPGSLLVDGTYAGDLVDLGPTGVLAAVRERLGA